MKSTYIVILIIVIAVLAAVMTSQNETVSRPLGVYMHGGSVQLNPK